MRATRSLGESEMGKLGLVLAGAGALVAACATSTEEPASAPASDRVVDDPRLDAVTAKQLETFQSEQAFKDYLVAVGRLRDLRAQERDGQSGEPPPEACGAAPCPDPAPEAASEPRCEDDPRCEPAAPITSRPGSAPPAMAASEAVVVTGSRVAASDSSSSAAASITNTQKIGVDEGDIVKQIGRHLIVLQDGRLFTVDTQPGGEPGLALVDRADVYDDPEVDTWYDEILVHRDRIVVTGYSYDLSASVLGLFKLSPEGRVAHEATFFMSTSDYYDIENYATRLVEGTFVVYSPLFVSELDDLDALQWPFIRRWLPGKERDQALSEGRQLYDARSIHKPLLRTLSPVVHTITVCPLAGELGPGEPDCRSTAFAGPEGRAFYVSRTHAYLWIMPGYEELESEEAGPACGPDKARGFDASPPAALVRVPLAGGSPQVMGVRGYPQNQFALETTDRDFRALLNWDSYQCEPSENATPIKYFAAPLSGFGRTMRPAVARRYVDAPDPKAYRYEVRFTDTHAVYGGRNSWESYPPDQAGEPQTARLVALPARNPHLPAILEAPHDIIRIERVGEDIALTGYRDAAGLSVSMLTLGAAPKIASTDVLTGRYESEGRSHAFNATLAADGGMLGLPTVKIADDSGRWWWRSDNSDVSFLAFDKARRLSSLGALEGRQGGEHPSYRCEVSCVDWYGNARPIFTDGRVFALSGVALIEGEVRDGRIEERGRLDLSAPLPAQP